MPAALCSASVSNLLGIFITPLFVALLLPASGAGFSPHALGEVAAQILVPFLARQAVRRWIGDWLLRHRTLTAIADRGSVLMVVYAAFSAGIVAGVWSQLSAGDLATVLLIDLMVLGFVIVATAMSCRALRFSTEDEIAIVFCGSKKSMAAASQWPPSFSQAMRSG